MRKRASKRLKSLAQGHRPLESGKLGFPRRCPALSLTALLQPLSRSLSSSILSPGPPRLLPPTRRDPPTCGPGKWGRGLGEQQGAKGVASVATATGKMCGMGLGKHVPGLNPS